MAIDRATPRSRRALLAAGLAAGVAAVASAIGRPLPGSATEGEVVVVGGKYIASSVTSFTTGATGQNALAGYSRSGEGVFGSSASYIGVEGTSGPGLGVVGTSGSGTGVVGGSSSGTGVHGYSDAGVEPAILGTSIGSSTGVMGYSGSPASTPAPTPKTGVFGYAAPDATAIGVKGASTAGVGVLATATTGTAIRVVGKAEFSRSGRATVPKGKDYTDIMVAGGLTSRSVVNATLQTYRPGVAVAAVRLNYPSRDMARIYLTKVASTTSRTYVGWFVAEH